MYWWNVYYSTPTTLKHRRESIFSYIKCWTEVQSNNFFPFMLWEILTLIDMLYTSIIYYNINTTKFCYCLFNKILTIKRFCQICINEESFNLGVFNLEIFLNSIYLFLCGKTIKNNIKSSLCKSMSDSKTYATKWTSYNCNFIFTKSLNNLPLSY